jgi:Cft2 family RNA processing exonuclease
MQITDLNPSEGIGASGWMVEMEGFRILLDAGVNPKLEGWAGVPMYDKVKDHPLDAIAISHCHHDHVGSLPVALKYFPQAHVLMTELSYFIVERVLHNSVNVMIRQKEELGIREYPLYSHRELDDIAHIFQGYRYNREIEWAAPSKARRGKQSPTLEFFDAGHALGSAGIMLRSDHETMFYTGDVCFQDQTILKGARFEDVSADVLILETTRGEREVPKGQTRATEIERLTGDIMEVLENKGCVLIPTFALGRTQEILAHLALMTREGKLKPQPIFIGGMGRVFTEIYDLESHRAHRNHTNLQLHEALNLTVLDYKQLEKIRLKGGRLFVMTAGMMNENTAAHELALRLAGDEKHAIFFVGYADPSTPAGRLRAAEPGKPFLFSASGGELTRKCRMEEYDLTAHANRDELLNFVGTVDPKVVILGHGEPDSKAWFAGQIKSKHPKIKVVITDPGKPVEC